MKLIFAYGTLMKGFGNHHLLGNSHLVANARTAPGFAIYDNGWFPCMVGKVSTKLSVSGEVYRVDDDTLGQLDSLEGEGAMYRRVKTAVHDVIDPHRGYSVETYLYLGSITGMTLIESGDYHETQRSSGCTLR